MSDGFVLPRSGESTSAALRRVERERDQANDLTDKIAAELRLVTRERDSLARRCAVRFEETKAAEAELASAQTELDLVRRDLAHARHERDMAVNNREQTTRRELKRLRSSPSWIVARDVALTCVRCDAEITRGQAYELVALDSTRHIHCPDRQEPTT